MIQVKQQFEQNLLRVKDLGGLHKAISSITTKVVDKSDILRSEIVLAVSALDHFVHEITVMGMLESYDGKRPATDAFLRFQVPIDGIHPGNQLQRHTFEAAIRDRHSYLSFQRPDKIADAIRLFSPIKLWDSIGVHWGQKSEDLKILLNLAIDRRNKIAHEADADPSYPNTKWPIAETDVNSVIDIVELVGVRIYHVAV